MTGPGMLGHINAMNRGPATGPVGATGANGPVGYVGVQRENPKWALTPWWVFWRPKWCKRRFDWGLPEPGSRGGYHYQTDRQRARQILQEQFG